MSIIHKVLAISATTAACAGLWSFPAALNDNNKMLKICQRVINISNVPLFACLAFLMSEGEISALMLFSTAVIFSGMYMYSLDGHWLLSRLFNRFQRQQKTEA